jgi:ferredoxin-type protein NapG
VSDREIRKKGLQLQRRELVACAGGLAGMLALGAAGAALKGDKTLIRPPGGQDEAAFLSLCIKCDRCRSVCPEGVIGVSTIFDGLVSMRTPVMDFRKGYCDFCKKCIDVCPTAALKPFSGQSVKIGVAELTESCIALRTGGCTKCFDVCPELAITLNKQNAPIIDREACSGCGLCVKVCPANVLQSYKGGKERGIVIKSVARQGGSR